MGDSSKVSVEGVSGELSIDGDVAGRDVVKKSSTAGKAVDAMAEQSKSSAEIMQYLSRALIEAQQEATRANQICSQRLNEQAERHQKQLDANAKADRKRSEWFENKIAKYDDAMGRIIKEKEHAYQAMQDGQDIIAAQRSTIEEQREIIDMQREAIDELKSENKVQAKQIDSLEKNVSHLENSVTDLEDIVTAMKNGGARNFHHPE